MVFYPYFFRFSFMLLLNIIWYLVIYSKWHWSKLKLGWRTMLGDWTRASFRMAQTVSFTWFFLRLFVSFSSTYGPKCRENEDCRSPRHTSYHRTLEASKKSCSTGNMYSGISGVVNSSPWSSLLTFGILEYWQSC